MQDAIATLNAGSSSLKFSVFDEQGSTLRRVLAGSIRGLDGSPRFVASDGDGKILEEKEWAKGTVLSHEEAMVFLFETLPARLLGRNVRAVGHRVVHGGPHYTAPVRIDADVLQTLESLAPLAPLHQLNNLAPIRTLLSGAPKLPQIA